MKSNLKVLAFSSCCLNIALDFPILLAQVTVAPLIMRAGRQNLGKILVEFQAIEALNHARL